MLLLFGLYLLIEEKEYSAETLDTLAVSCPHLNQEQMSIKQAPKLVVTFNVRLYKTIRDHHT